MISRLRGRSSTIAKEAAKRLARMHAEDRTSEDVEKCRAWLSADPAHADAFDRATTVWNALGSADFRDLDANSHRRSLNRRAILVGAASVVVTIGATSAWRTAQAGVYETRVGERRDIRLESGSRITLDTDTRLRIREVGPHCLMTLHRGRANISVSGHRTDPVFIEAANQRVALEPGASCDVRSIDRDQSFHLLAGDAFVAPKAGRGSQSLRLRSGQRLIIDEGLAAEASGLPRIDHPDERASLAWRDGRAMFSDTPLSEAVKEMNRYSTTKLEVADPALARRRISGLYSVGDSADFAESVALMFEGKVRIESDRIVIESITS